MCIAFFGYNLDDYKLPLVLASNRDEFWSRPTAPLHWWTTNEQKDLRILAGKDLQQGGTWLAVNEDDDDRRLAVVTNYREPLPPNYDSSQPHPSRGKLVTDFVSTHVSIDDFVTHLQQDGHQYAGFNLLFGSRTLGFFFYSNRCSDNRSSCSAIPLKPGRLYSMSNGFLDEPWPKLVRGKAVFSDVLNHYNGANKQDLQDGLWNLLTDQWKPPDKDLPSTGVTLELERALSSIFVQASQFDYGTRCSTVILETADGTWQVHERTYRQGQSNKEELLDPQVDFNVRTFRLT